MITVHTIRPFRLEKYPPTPEQDAFIRYWRYELAQLPTEQILHWGIDTFQSRLALVTSCGVGGSVLISMFDRLKLDIPVISADPGNRFGKTKRLHERLEEKFGIRIVVDSPSDGPYEQSLCCGGKKLVSLRRIAGRFDAWISESRRDRSTDAFKRSVIDWDERLGLFRINPLIRWTRESVVNKAICESIPFDKHAAPDYFDDDCHACLFSRRIETGTDRRSCCSEIPCRPID